MTTLNVLAYPDRVHILVDSLGLSNLGAGSPYATSKFAPLVHLNAVIAMRGTLRVLPIVWAAANEVAGDFDAVAAALPRILDDISSQFGGTSSAQVVFAGWSPNRGRMIALRFEASPDGSYQMPREIHSLLLLSGDVYAGVVPTIDTLPQLINSARLQIKHELEANPGGPFGGRLIMAEIRQDSTVIRFAAAS